MCLVSRGSAPLCRLPVRADFRVLGRKDVIVTGNLSSALSRNLFPGAQFVNPLLDLLDG